VDPAFPPSGVPRIIVPRRLFPKNGVEFFIRALPRIVEEVLVEALLVGDGPEREKLEALVGDLGLGGVVRFLGKQPHRRMPALLSSGELAVIPSLMEATSVAGLEAMACGVPVAASNVGGLPEIVDERVGGLFPPGDPEGMAEVIVRLLRSPELAEKGRAARERVVAEWSNQRLAQRHVDIYEALLESR
jgi:glycosyltransferase involved in cell wall biosynthesis